MVKGSKGDLYSALGEKLNPALKLVITQVHHEDMDSQILQQK